MRYFEIKSPVEDISPAGTKISVSYKALFRDLLCVDSKLNAEQFLRIGTLYSRFKDLGDGDILEIEDQDFSTLQIKLDGLTQSAQGFLRSGNGRENSGKVRRNNPPAIRGI